MEISQFASQQQFHIIQTRSLIGSFRFSNFICSLFLNMFRIQVSSPFPIDPMIGIPKVSSLISSFQNDDLINDHLPHSYGASYT
jgi:hypothetical protein